MTDWKAIKKAAEETGGKPWNPVGGFDINGDIPEHSPVDHEKAFGRAMKYGLGAGGLTWFVHWLLTRKKEDRIAQAKKRLKWALGIGGAAAAYGYGDSVVEDAIRGTRFNYEGYKPKGPGDYNIIVAGAGSGAHDHWYKRTYDKYLGEGNYVMFNPRDEKAMRSFVSSIPKDGSRVRIYGHSRGGRPAFELARFAAGRGIKVDSLDTVDIVGKPWNENLPDGVKWRNWVLLDRPRMDPSKWHAIKDFLTVGGIDGDLVATAGGVTGYLPYADNRIIDNPPAMSHGNSILGVLNWTAQKFH